MVHRAADLFTQQEANRRKSSWLLLGFVFFFAWLGFTITALAVVHTFGYRKPMFVVVDGVGIGLVLQQ